MADKPEAFIEAQLAPDERVVYRDSRHRPPRWVPADWPSALLLMGMISVYWMGPAFRSGAGSNLPDLAI